MSRNLRAHRGEVATYVDAALAKLGDTAGGVATEEPESVETPDAPAEIAPASDDLLAARHAPSVPPAGQKRKVLLRNFQCPGDVVMLTAAVRDLHRAAGDRFEITVDTSCNHLWDFNPYVRPYDPSVSDYLVVDCEYPLIHRSNSAPYHFIHGFAQHIEATLGVWIPLTEFKGDIHLSDIEKTWMSQVAETGFQGDFWIVMAGGKYDYTCKWWNPAFYQAVIDHFAGKIQFVQCGEQGHWHPPLKNVINLIGKTDLRQFIRLVYHSVGVLAPVTFAMHAAAAVPTPVGRPPSRACVVIAGGREPAHWEAYPTHRFLSNNGALPCCLNGGCWRSRCQKVYDGDQKDHSQLCETPVAVAEDLSIARCMEMIRPQDVIRAIESYYEGGALRYLS